ncbi:MAG: hypothetical protein WC924_06095 [Candidatus Gracilibacteria bacterium]
MFIKLKKSLVQRILYGLIVIIGLTGLAATYVLNSADRELGAYYLAQNKFRDSTLSCLENFDGKLDGYRVELSDQGELRTVTFIWNTFFIPQSRTFTFLTTPGCVLD